MNRTDILDAVAEALNEVADIEPATVTLAANLDEDLDLDSLSMVEVLVTLEERLGVKLSDEDVSTLKHVQDLITVIEQQIEARGNAPMAASA